MSIDEMIAVLQAAKAGKQIELRCADGTWGYIDTPSWNFNDHTYRVKPEPREGWISPLWLESKKHDWIKVREVLE